MSYQIREVENGTEITVQADEAAVIVREDGEERIYLPGNSRECSTYYTSDRKRLGQKEKGFTVVHSGVPDSVKVFSM